MGRQIQIGISPTQVIGFGTVTNTGVNTVTLTNHTITGATIAETYYKTFEAPRIQTNCYSIVNDTIMKRLFMFFTANSYNDYSSGGWFTWFDYDASAKTNFNPQFELFTDMVQVPLSPSLSETCPAVLMRSGRIVRLAKDQSNYPFLTVLEY
jgi:hypothetical protein